MLGQPRESSWPHRSLFGKRERVRSRLGLSRPPPLPPLPKERQNAKPESVSATSALLCSFWQKASLISESSRFCRTNQPESIPRSVLSVRFPC